MDLGGRFGGREVEKGGGGANELVDVGCGNLLLLLSGGGSKLLLLPCV